MRYLQQPCRKKIVFRVSIGFETNLYYLQATISHFGVMKPLIFLSIEGSLSKHPKRNQVNSMGVKDLPRRSVLIVQVKFLNVLQMLKQTFHIIGSFSLISIKKMVRKRTKIDWFNIKLMLLHPETKMRYLTRNTNNLCNITINLLNIKERLVMV